MMFQVLAAAETMSGASDQLRNFVNGVTSLSGIIASICFVILASATIFWSQTKWFVLTLLLYVSTLTAFDMDRPVNWLIQQLSLQGRAITIGLMLILLIPSLRASHSRRTRTVGTAMAFFFFQMVVSGRFLVAGLFDRAVFGTGIFILTFLTLAVGLGRWLETKDDVRRLMMCFNGAMALFIAGNLLQFFIDPNAAVHNGRFLGSTDNPQHMAESLEIFCLPAIYVLSSRGEPYKYRLTMAILVAIAMVLLIWTGSRTGILMMTVGLLVFFRRRLHHFLLTAAVVAIFLLIVIQIISGSSAGAEHLTSLQNTRAEAWTALIAEFESSPVVGVIHADFDAPESSYLSTAARFGIIGLIPLGLAMVFCAWNLYRLGRLGKRHAADRQLSDLILAGFASLATAAIFEAILLATIALWVFVIYIYFAILAYQLDPATQIDTRAEFDGTGENIWDESQMMGEANLSPQMIVGDAYIR